MRRSGYVATSAVAGALLAIPGQAGAAVTIGSDLAPDPVNSACGGPGACTIANTALPGQQITSPTNGVIVRWRVRVNFTDLGGNAVRLSVIHQASGGAFTGVNASSTVTIPQTALSDETTYAFSAQQPIAAGDQLALDLDSPTNNLGIMTGNQPGVTRALWAPQLAVGESRTPNSTITQELMLNADVEADCDRDGLGDETQDPLIPSVVACDPIAPNGKIKKGPRKLVETEKAKAKVKFRFSSDEVGSTFECKLDRKPFKPCSSPKRYRIKATEKAKKHTFRVRAIDVAGNSDLTPAKRSFKVKRLA
jgi:hypothetical protein